MSGITSSSIYLAVNEFLNLLLPARLRSDYTTLGTEYLGDLDLVVSQRRNNRFVATEPQNSGDARLEAQ